MASNIADQAKANEQGKKVPCTTCLINDFSLSMNEMNALISGDPSTFPQC